MLRSVPSYPGCTELPSKQGQPKFSVIASDTSAMRLISSQSFQPTSATQSSLVPGRKLMRNGLRNPVATTGGGAGKFIGSSMSGPFGSTRMTFPLNQVANFGVATGGATTCERSAPPIAVGGVSV